MRRLLVLLIAVVLSTGCVSRPDPEPALQRDSLPPWSAPRDAISYIQAAGVPELGLGDDADPWILDLEVVVDGDPVEIPAFIGIDRLRAVQAPVHTHDPGGEVWLEGDGNRDSTLAHFFALWGVRFTPECIGGVCGAVSVTVDGEAVETAPADVLLRGARHIEVVVTS